MKTILRFIFVAVILIGLLIMSAEPADGGSVLPSMFIGGCCMLFAWGLWENNEELRNWK